MSWPALTRWRWGASCSASGLTASSGAKSGGRSHGPRLSQVTGGQGTRALAWRLCNFRENTFGHYVRHGWYWWQEGEEKIVWFLQVHDSAADHSQLCHQVPEEFSSDGGWRGELRLQCLGHLGTLGLLLALYQDTQLLQAVASKNRLVFQ